jgi:hypothetical protein
MGTCIEPIINLSVWCSSMKKKKMTTTNQRYPERFCDMAASGVICDLRFTIDD